MAPPKTVLLSKLPISWAWAAEGVSTKARANASVGAVVDKKVLRICTMFFLSAILRVRPGRPGFTSHVSEEMQDSRLLE
jgi:hypothetical protein